MSAAAVWAVVLVKPFHLAKERLGTLLDADERAQLAQRMLEDVLETLRVSAPLLSGVFVVTADPVAAALARRHGAEVIAEPAAAGMNSAVRLTVDRLAGTPGAGLVVIPSDLPQITPATVARAVQILRARRSVVLVRAHDGGTNLLACRPAGVIATAFGPASFRRHCQAAARAGIPAIALAGHGLSRDLDCADDVLAYLALGTVTRTHAYLAGLGIDERLNRSADPASEWIPDRRRPQPSDRWP